LGLDKTFHFNLNPNIIELFPLSFRFLVEHYTWGGNCNQYYKLAQKFDSDTPSHLIGLVVRFHFENLIQRLFKMNNLIRWQQFIRYRGLKKRVRGFCQFSFQVQCVDELRHVIWIIKKRYQLVVEFNHQTFFSIQIVCKLIRKTVWYLAGLGKSL